jgi:hypothetical protein
LRATNFLSRSTKSISEIISICTDYANAYSSSVTQCQWSSVWIVQTQRTSMTSSFLRSTNRQWIFMDWYTQDSSYLPMVSPWWKKNICWASLATVHAFSAKGRTFYL